MSALLSRRSLFGFAAACPLCISAARAADHASHWGYEGAAGPSHWGKLSPEFRSCALGTQQTPIDLTGPIPAEPGPLALAYQALPLRVLNNGHTIQVNAAPGSRLQLANTPYELLQIHFHHPSEHLLSGKPFDMECHFVHKAASGALAVVGVFIRPGAANAALAPIWQAMPAKEGPEQAVSGVTVDPAALLPQERRYFRYMGSLTTPPCSEGITWTIFPAPIEASAEQIRRFAALFPNNARPVQPINRRFLLQAG